MIDCMLKRFAVSAGSECCRCRTKSHRAAGRSDGLEHLRDVRIHGQIKSQGEGTGKFGSNMFHRHFPRQSLRITGIDQPGSIAIEDREHGIKHIAHHLLEVVRSLDRSVNLIHALQEPEMSLVLLLGLLAFGDVRHGAHEFKVARFVYGRMADNSNVFD